MWDLFFGILGNLLASNEGDRTQLEVTQVLLSRQLQAFGATLAIWAVVGGAEEGAAQEPGSYGWYVSASGGTNWNPVMKQAGHNRDNICYPNDLCSGTPGGYRWYYDLPSDLGAALEVAFGRKFSGVRLEVSASQRSNNVEQEFTDITFLDGSPILPNEDSNYTSTSTTRVDALAVRTLSLNAYHDFSFAENRVMPYLGAGVGLSSMELSGLYFSSEYSCINQPCGGRPAAEYNSLQDVDLSDSGLSKQIFAGADYRLGDKFLVGVKASYIWVDDLEDTSPYEVHPLPIPNDTEISGINPWSMMLGFKYVLRE